MFEILKVAFHWNILVRKTLYEMSEFVPSCKTSTAVIDTFVCHGGFVVNIALSSKVIKTSMIVSQILDLPVLTLTSGLCLSSNIAWSEQVLLNRTVKCEGPTTTEKTIFCPRGRGDLNHHDLFECKNKKLSLNFELFSHCLLVSLFLVRCLGAHPTKP